MYFGTVECKECFILIYALCILMFQIFPPAAHAATHWQEVQMRTSGMSHDPSHSIRAQEAPKAGPRWRREAISVP